MTCAIFESINERLDIRLVICGIVFENRMNPSWKMTSDPRREVTSQKQSNTASIATLHMLSAHHLYSTFLLTTCIHAQEIEKLHCTTFRYSRNNSSPVVLLSSECTAFSPAMCIIQCARRCMLFRCVITGKPDQTYVRLLSGAVSSSQGKSLIITVSQSGHR